MKETSLRLEVEFSYDSRIKMHVDDTAQITPKKMNKFIIMSCHRWFITVFPIRIVHQVIIVSSCVR